MIRIFFATVLMFTGLLFTGISANALPDWVIESVSEHQQRPQEHVRASKLDVIKKVMTDCKKDSSRLCALINQEKSQLQSSEDLQEFWLDVSIKCLRKANSGQPIDQSEMCELFRAALR